MICINIKFRVTKIHIAIVGVYKIFLKVQNAHQMYLCIFHEISKTKFKY